MADEFLGNGFRKKPEQSQYPDKDTCDNGEVGTSGGGDSGGSVSASQKTGAYAGTGIMIALFLPQEIAEKVAIPDAETIDELHITLAFLDEKGDKDDPAQIANITTALIQALTPVVGKYGPIQATISGFGKFVGDDNVFYLSPDGPQFPFLRQDIVEAIELAGFHVSRTHGFSPHITLSYLEDGEDIPDYNLPENLTLTFDKLSIAVAGSRSELPFNTQIKNSHKLADDGTDGTDVTNLPSASPDELKSNLNMYDQQLDQRMGPDSLDPDKQSTKSAQLMMTRFNEFSRTSFVKKAWTIDQVKKVLSDRQADKIAWKHTSQADTADVEIGSGSLHLIAFPTVGIIRTLDNNTLYRCEANNRYEVRAKLEERLEQYQGFVSASKTANQYIHEESPGDWVITQKGTGKTLSHHTSEEKANEAFSAMEMNKHSKTSKQNGLSSMKRQSNDNWDRGFKDGQEGTKGLPDERKKFTPEEIAYDNGYSAGYYRDRPFHGLESAPGGLGLLGDGSGEHGSWGIGGGQLASNAITDRRSMEGNLVTNKPRTQNRPVSASRKVAQQHDEFLKLIDHLERFAAFIGQPPLRVANALRIAADEDDAGRDTSNADSSDTDSPVDHLVGDGGPNNNDGSDVDHDDLVDNPDGTPDSGSSDNDSSSGKTSHKSATRIVRKAGKYFIIFDNKQLGGFTSLDTAQRIASRIVAQDESTPEPHDEFRSTPDNTDGWDTQGVVWPESDSAPEDGIMGTDGVVNAGAGSEGEPPKEGAGDVGSNFAKKTPQRNTTAAPKRNPTRQKNAADVDTLRARDRLQDVSNLDEPVGNIEFGPDARQAVENLDDAVDVGNNTFDDVTEPSDDPVEQRAKADTVRDTYNNGMEERGMDANDADKQHKEPSDNGIKFSAVEQSERLLKIFAFVESREKLGLSSVEKRPAEVAKYERMSNDVLNAHISSLEDAKKLATMNTQTTQRSAGRLPDLGRSVASSSADNLLPDDIVFL